MNIATYTNAEAGLEALVSQIGAAKFKAVLRDTDANETFMVCICTTLEMATAKAKAFVTGVA